MSRTRKTLGTFRRRRPTFRDPLGVSFRFVYMHEFWSRCWPGQSQYIFQGRQSWRSLGAAIFEKSHNSYIHELRLFIYAFYLNDSISEVCCGGRQIGRSLGDKFENSSWSPVAICNHNSLGSLYRFLLREFQIWTLFSHWKCCLTNYSQRRR